MLKVEQLWELLAGLEQEIAESVPVVSLKLDGGQTIDVFRAERVREQPIAWRIRGFTPERDTPSELRAVLLGTTDGRAMLMIGADQAPGGGTVVVEATAETRPLSDLADVIAQAVRRRFE